MVSLSQSMATNADDMGEDLAWDLSVDFRREHGTDAPVFDAARRVTEGELVYRDGARETFRVRVVGQDPEWTADLEEVSCPVLGSDEHIAFPEGFNNVLHVQLDPWEMHLMYQSPGAGRAPTTE